MRVITDETREVLTVFGRTHELASLGMGAQWRMAWLPDAGSVNDQDAWLWEALQVVRDEQTRELMRDTRESSGGLAAWRARKARDKGE